MSEEILCPLCDNTMTRGFTVDRGYQRVTLAEWFQGEPTISKVFGMPVTGNVRGEVPGVPLAAFRCSQCGKVEWFAREEFGVQ